MKDLARSITSFCRTSCSCKTLGCWKHRWTVPFNGSGSVVECSNCITLQRTLTPLGLASLWIFPLSSISRYFLDYFSMCLDALESIFVLSSGDPVDWEPLRLQWELENSIINWNYEEFISEYNLALVTSNWHITQHFDPRE